MIGSGVNGTQSCPSITGNEQQYLNKKGKRVKRKEPGPIPYKPRRRRNEKRAGSSSSFPSLSSGQSDLENFQNNNMPMMMTTDELALPSIQSVQFQSNFPASPRSIPSSFSSRQSNNRETFENNIPMMMSNQLAVLPSTQTVPFQSTFSASPTSKPSSVSSTLSNSETFPPTQTVPFEPTFPGSSNSTGYLLDSVIAESEARFGGTKFNENFNTCVLPSSSSSRRFNNEVFDNNVFMISDDQQVISSTQTTPFQSTTPLSEYLDSIVTESELRFGKSDDNRDVDTSLSFSFPTPQFVSDDAFVFNDNMFMTKNQLVHPSTKTMPFQQTMSSDSPASGLIDSVVAESKARVDRRVNEKANASSILDSSLSSTLSDSSMYSSDLDIIVAESNTRFGRRDTTTEVDISSAFSFPCLIQSSTHDHHYQEQPPEPEHTTLKDGQLEPSPDSSQTIGSLAYSSIFSDLTPLPEMELCNLSSYDNIDSVTTTQYDTIFDELLNFSMETSIVTPSTKTTRTPASVKGKGILESNKQLNDSQQKKKKKRILPKKHLTKETSGTTHEKSPSTYVDW